MKLSLTRLRGLGLLTALAVLTGGAALTPAAATTASSGGWNDYSCAPSPAHPRAVVLVHGTFGNSVDNWRQLAPYLVERGYCVFSLDYGQLPEVPFFHGLGPIEDSAGQLDRFVDRVLAQTNTQEVDLVGHSQGGMMPRYYLKFLGGAEKVNALVGLAPDNHGTDLNGLTALQEQFPGSGDLIGERAPALQQQTVGSEFLRRLNEGGDTVPGVRYTVIATRHDEVVTPYSSQFLAGPEVTNVLLQDLCPVNFSEHLAIALTDRMAFHETANALDPEHAEPTTCLSS